jgi:RNA recognition motif-containing protein
MNIYIGNLSQSVTEETLRELFQEFGKVDTVKVIKDKFTGAPRGFAFVEMSNQDEAQQAINELNGTDIDGLAIRVNEARPQENRPQGGFRSNGGGNRRPGGSGFGGPRGGGHRSGSGFGGPRR